MISVVILSSVRALNKQREMELDVGGPAGL